MCGLSIRSLHSKKVEQKYDEQSQDTSLIVQTKVLKNGDDFTINWISDKLKMFIWDTNQEDGDKITLIINGKSILTDFETTNKRKKVKFKLQEGENIVEIRATNLGVSPPNTSRVELVDRKTKYPIIIQLTLENSVIIKVIK